MRRKRYNAEVVKNKVFQIKGNPTLGETLRPNLTDNQGMHERLDHTLGRDRWPREKLKLVSQWHTIRTVCTTSVTPSSLLFRA
jgi:hypothetical protein